MGVVLLLASGPGGAIAAADDWPQWRGPAGHGISPESELPTSWSEREGVAWKAPLAGTGASSPIVWGDRVFVTSQVGRAAVAPGQHPRLAREEPSLAGRESPIGGTRHDTDAPRGAIELVVEAFRRSDGTRLWDHRVEATGPFPELHEKHNLATPTPVTDGERVYAYFGSEGVYAYDFDGKPAWSRDIGDIKSVGLGVASSPVLWRDLLLLQADEDSGEASFIVALDRRTGAEVWRKPRPVQASWTTPTLITGPDGKEQLLTSGNEHLIAYDPANGAEIWRTKGLDSNAIHTPLQAGSTVIFTAGYPKKIVLALELPKQGDLTAAEPFAWTYDKGTAYVPSNLVYDGHLYLVSDSGLLTCLDAKTGKLIYEGGRPAEQGRYTASPTVVDGAILLISRDGDASFVKPGPQHEVLASTSLDEPVAASPAVAGGRLYVRGEQHLYAIGAR
jgi:outer membrane protein assembly factor BamB